MAKEGSFQKSVKIYIKKFKKPIANIVFPKTSIILTDYVFTKSTNWCYI